MPVTEDGYEKRDAEELLDVGESVFAEKADVTPELGPYSTWTAYLEAVADTLVQEQEAALGEVYNAAFPQTSHGVHLEYNAALVDLERLEGAAATGAQRFEASDPVYQDHVISEGTEVKTSNEGITFETTEQVTMPFYDGFEHLSDGEQPSQYWEGELTGWAGQSTVVHRGDRGLFSDTGDGHQRITRSSSTIRRGDTAVVWCQIQGSSTYDSFAELLYMGHVDWTDSYALRADADANSLQIRNKDGRQASANVSIPTETLLRLEVTPGLDGTHHGKVFDASGASASLLGEVMWDENSIEWYEGRIGLGASSSLVYFDDVTTRAVAVNIEATETGANTNVARGTINVMPSPPTGVNTTINPIPTGNRDLTDATGVFLRAGADEETDAELRDRLLDEGTGTQEASATAEGIIGAVSNIDTVTSVAVVENSSPSADGDGRPPHSIEVVVPSRSDTKQVARAIFEEKCATTNTVGGYAGTKVTETITSDINGQAFTITLSEATEIQVSMSLSIVVNEDYAGDRALRNRIVDYIGGVKADGSTEIGTGIGEDVRIDEVKEAISEDDGVIGFDDSETTFSPSTSTDSNGLTVIAIGDTEIAETDATESAITITKTQV